VTMAWGDEQGAIRWGRMSEATPPGSLSEDEQRAILYRQSAENLRQLAGKVRFDFGRREQLLSMADAFDRAAARIEGLPVKRAAD
jgi:hypothetical protein